MTKFFLSIYDYFSTRRALLFSLLAAFTLLFATMSYGVRFKEDISRFLPDTKENKRINDAYQYVVGSSNKITVYCNAADSSLRDRQVEAVDALVEKITERIDTSIINGFLYEIDPTEMLGVSTFIVENMPYFMDDSDFAKLDSLLSREFVSRELEVNKKLLTSNTGLFLRQNFLTDPLHITSGLMRRMQNFQAGGQYCLYNDHIFSDDGKALLLIDCAVSSSETSTNEKFFADLKECLVETEKNFEGITFDSFGAAEIGLTNAQQIQRDTALSIILAVIIIFALLIYSFRNGWKICLVFLSVVFGGLFAMAMMWLIRGEVSIIAVGISSIMFGIAINYPLHFIDHHNHIPDSRTVIKDIISPLTIGNITTVGAFLSLVFIGSEAMCDLGWFAALLLVGTILFVLLFLPHFVQLRIKNYELRGTSNARGFRLISRSFERNKKLILTVILLTAILAFFSGDSRFETDMQKINYMTETQQKEFSRLMEVLNKSHQVVYFITEGKSPDAALQTNETQQTELQKMIDAGMLYNVGGIGSFYPSQQMQRQRIERWNAFWNFHREEVVKLLDEEAERLGFKAEAFDGFKDLINRNWDVVGIEYFDLIKETLAKNYIIENDDKTMIINLLYTDAEKAQSIEEKLNSKNDSSIAFDASSITRRMLDSLSDNFNYVLYVCGFIVFVFLIFSMGRIELSLIAFIPLTLSWIWILGLMNILDIKFNIVNIILATFIFGQGDDYTIFMTEGMMYEYAYGRKALATYKNSIALSALIMFVGMGMLIFAKHPALRSLAEVTIVGMFSVVLMAFIFPSLLFRMLTVHKGKKRLMPVTLKNFLFTVYAFVVFLILSAIITIVGWFMFTLTRPTEKKKLAYHRLLCCIARTVIYRVPQVKTYFKNLSGETFDKPNIIICNHQSHLDLMCILMLSPKIIVLTNKWVWNSPFYGRLIRYADFYPGTNGYTDAFEQIKSAVARGYSVAIFPEGTRSADCSILRFRRGAFYAAEKLGIDVVPVMIHGVGHVLPKEEFMLRKGEIHIRVMPRITPDDARFSKDYSSRSREVRRYYLQEYEKLCCECETPDYYADLVIHNYIYKGPEIERKVRRNLKQHNNYFAEISAMPDEGSVTLENVGYGEYPLLLALVKKRLQITATESDPDKLAIARNCASNPENLKYL